MKSDEFTGNKKKPFHSSIYAEASNGGSMGTVSPQPFSQRRHIEHNRQVVGRYNDSFVARGNHFQEESRHRLEPPQDDDHQGKAHGRPQASQAHGMRKALASERQNGSVSSQKIKVPPRKVSFKEPPTRFNPYQ